MSYYGLGLLVLVSPFLAGAISGALLEPRPIGFVGAHGLGVLVTGGGLIALVFSTENDQWAACGEDACSKFVGRWATTDHFTVFIPVALVTWALGAFAGWRLRWPSTP
jgi:hypothetical protein